MIDDKSLSKALRRAAKSGLTVFVSGEDVTMLTDNWMVNTTATEMRIDLRMTLGVLVEMLGYIPEKDSITIWKTKDGYEIQSEMVDSTVNRISTFLGQDVGEIFRTPLYYGWGGQLWQRRDRTLYGQKAVPPAGVYTGYMLTDAGTIRAETDGDGSVWFRVARPNEETDKEIRDRWALLESAWWMAAPHEEEEE